MVVAERAGIVLGQRVAVALAVGGAHERRHDLEVPLGDLVRLAPEVGEPEVDVELEQVDAGRCLRHVEKGRTRLGRHRSVGCVRYASASMGAIRVRPCSLSLAGVARARRRAARSSAATPPASSTSRAGSGWTTRGRSVSASSRASTTSRSPCTRRCSRFMGHAERDKKREHGARRCSTTPPASPPPRAPSSSSSTPASGSAATREQALDDVVEQLGELRERLEAEGPRRAVRGRGDGPRPRARLGRRRLRDRGAAPAGCGR